MANLAQLESLVVDDYTRRPEIPTVTRAAIRTAVLRAHHIDFFPRDLVQHAVTYTPLSSSVSYDIANLSTLIPRLRTIKTLVGTDSVTAVPVENFEFREVDDIYTADSCRRPSIYSLIGDTLRVYPQAVTGSLQLYYYQNPAFTAETILSWIADTYLDEIAAWSAAIVFARTGFTEQAERINATNIMPFKESLLSSHLLATVK